MVEEKKAGSKSDEKEEDLTSQLLGCINEYKIDPVVDKENGDQADDIVTKKKKIWIVKEDRWSILGGVGDLQKWNGPSLGLSQIPLREQTLTIETEEWIHKPFKKENQFSLPQHTSLQNTSFKQQ